MRDYPILDGLDAETGLLLFGAAFQGANDGRYLNEAGIVCTVVDIDAERIERMRPSYPDTWSYVCADAYRYASDANKRGARWDVVSVDPFSDEADLVFAGLETLWLPLARLLLVVGIENKNLATARRRGYEILQRNDAWSWVIV